MIMKEGFKKIAVFLAALALPLLAGFLGSMLTTPNISSWYESLAKPVLAPPNWLFAPVWTILFLLMGVASYLVWKNGRGHKYYRRAWASYGAQLFLNIYWSFLFFSAHNPALAFYGLVSLWSMIVVNIYYFSQIKKAAAWLLVPYILWVTFAGYLNYSIWLLNI